MAKTFYDIFEVGTNATPDEIRAAYKRMVQRHHPDKHRGRASSEELLKAINYAYSILSDPLKRANYDAKLINSSDAEADAMYNAGNAYVYTGEPTVNSTANAQSATHERADTDNFRHAAAGDSRAAWGDRVSAEATASRKRAARLSPVSRINSWLALGLLFLVFLAISRFFYQVTVYKLFDAVDPDGTTLFYGIITGAIIASGAVWLVGKMVTHTLPLTWPMNVIFREKVRADLQPEHRRIASAVLIMGMLLTFVVPRLDNPADLARSLAHLSGVTSVDDARSPEFSARGTLQNAQQGAPQDTKIDHPPPLPTLAMPPPVPIKPARAVDIEVPAPKTPSVEAPPVKVAVVPPTPRQAPVEKKSVVIERRPAPQAAKAPPAVEKPVPKSSGVAASGGGIPEKKEASSPIPAPEKTGAVAQKPAPVAEPKGIEGGELAKYRKGAQQGVADAQYQLGRAYEKGEGAARDYKQARAWYSKAADQGYGLAQHSLGSMYMLGKGGEMDPVAAYMWLSLAVNNHVTTSQQALDYLADTLTPAQLADAKRKMARWSPQRKR